MSLRQEIHDLSWNKTSFRSKLQLFSKSRKLAKYRIRWNDEIGQAEAYSALSSTYYSITGTAVSQLKVILQPNLLICLAPLRLLLWCITWLPLAAWCYVRMLPLSNKMVKLIGYEDMSADQCDIRQCILRRRGRTEEAKSCIVAALHKGPEKAHTRGLLHAALAGLLLNEGESKYAESELDAALIEAKVAEEEDLRQAARIYRYCANLIDKVKPDYPLVGKRLRHKAEELARLARAEDQLLKIR